MQHLTRKTTEKIVTLGHRGMGESLPHNSLQASSQALKSSLLGIELDVRIFKFRDF
jgi:glycerophosphoryl diester phosphodiesterase